MPFWHPIRKNSSESETAHERKYGENRRDSNRFFLAVVQSGTDVYDPIDYCFLCMRYGARLYTAIFRLSGIRVLEAIAKFYIWIIRGTPLLVQLFVIFYGLPSLGIVLSPFVSGVLGLSLCQGAYNSEIVRAAILAVPGGQWEAAKALGMNKAQTYLRIVIPQAARTAVPSLGNQFIGLTKDTSLAGMLTIPELLQTGQQITAVVYEPLALYLEVAFIYLLMNSVLTLLQGKLEKRLSKHVQKTN